MDDSEIIALYFLRDQRAVSETETKYGAYLLKNGKMIGEPERSEQDEMYEMRTKRLCKHHK